MHKCNYVHFGLKCTELCVEKGNPFLKFKNTVRNIFN